MWGVRDPVCNVKISKKRAHRYQLNGKTYYFDSAACRQTFKDNPQNFVGKRINKNLIKKMFESGDGERKTCH